MKILETERLYLRALTPDDAGNLFLLNQDPEVIKFTGDAPFNTIDQATYFLKHYNHYRKYGFGRWAVIRKIDEEFLGWCGLHKKHWHQGYATEYGLYQSVRKNRLDIR